MIKSDLKPLEKILIENDLFEVVKKTDKRKSLGCYEYLLRPLQEDVLSATIRYFNSDKIILEIARIVDCQIKGRAIQYKGQIYQISKQYDEVFYDTESDAMVRNTIYEIKNLRENSLLKENQKKIVVDHKKNKIFYDFREITMNEFSEPREIKEEKGRAETICFRYTFKEPVG